MAAAQPLGSFMKHQRAPLRIAVTGLRGIPGVMGGVETHCEELLPRVAALDSALGITVLGRAPYLPQGAGRVGGVAVEPLPAPRRQSLEAIVSTLCGVLWARRRGYDLLHIHAIGPGLLAPLARLLGLRVVLTHHGADYDRAKWGRFARWSLKLGEQWGVRAAHSVIAVSPSLTDELKRRFPEHAARICFIPNGAPALGETVEPRAAVLDRLGLEPGRFVLAVGRLVPEKGHEYLIEAFLQSGSDRVLAVVGAADHDSEYARRLAAQPDPRVRFLGLQPRPVLRHLYETAALFVLPSFHEGLPIVALEAARCGAPMLLSDIAANRDIGLPLANYFPVGNVTALTDALTADPANFAVDGERIRKVFDWDQIARETLETYQEAARRD
jgi:glycosyltransferase involved in cell wall biosynthesis